MNYPINVNKKRSNILTPSNSYYSNEYAEEICKLHLRDEVHKDKNGNTQMYYRLHAKEHHTVEDALAYDIHCPKCKDGILKQVERCVDSKELGLYTCPTCNKPLKGGSIYE